jgi:hypothetical protein
MAHEGLQRSCIVSSGRQGVAIEEHPRDLNDERNTRIKPLSNEVATIRTPYSKPFNFLSNVLNELLARGQD